MSRKRLTAAVTIALLVGGSALFMGRAGAQVPTNTNPGNHAIFPAKDQSPEQQVQDQLAAYNWATQQTGWDPCKAHEQLNAQSNAAAQTANQAGGGAVKGAAKGALAGVAIGAIAGDAGKGAAIGAAAGGLTGGMRSRRTRRGASASTNQAASTFQQQFAGWDKYYVAAMEGKGYTVK